MPKVAYTEFAVELRSTADGSFISQLEVYPIYEEAERCWQSLIDYGTTESIADTAYPVIVYIDYDENDNEIGFGTYC